MEPKDKLEEAAKKKEQGNALFKSGKIFHASRKYEKVDTIYHVIMLYLIMCASF